MIAVKRTDRGAAIIGRHMARWSKTRRESSRFAQFELREGRMDTLNEKANMICLFRIVHYTIPSMASRLKTVVDQVHAWLWIKSDKEIWKHIWAGLS